VSQTARSNLETPVNSGVLAGYFQKNRFEDIKTEFPRKRNWKKKMFWSTTLFGETFAREILAFFAKVYLVKNLKSFIRESSSREILLILQLAKVYPVNSEVFSANDFHFSLNPLISHKIREFPKFSKIFEASLIRPLIIMVRKFQSNSVIIFHFM